MERSEAAGRHRYGWELFAIFMGAFVLRVAYVALRGSALPADTDLYRTIAGNLLSGGGFSIEAGTPTAFRPPGYPLFIALVEGVTRGPWFVIWAQCLAGACAVFLAAWLARSMVGDLFALAAACIVAVDPYEIAVCGEFMTEPLFLLLVTASFVALMRAFATSSIKRYVLAGAVAGAGILTRPEFMVFVPGALAAMLRWGQDTKRGRCMEAFIVAACILPAAWGTRNQMELGRFVVTTTHGKYTQRLPYNAVFYSEVVAGPDETWSNASLSAWQERLAAESQGMAELAQDDNNYRIAAGFILPDLRRALRVALYEAGSFWRPYPHNRGLAVTLVLLVFFVVLAVVAAIGISVGMGRGPFVPLALYVLAAETCVHMLYWSNVRMRIPFHPLLAVMAAAAVAAMFKRKTPEPEAATVRRVEEVYSPAA